MWLTANACTHAHHIMTPQILPCYIDVVDVVDIFQWQIFLQLQGKMVDWI